jgi:hypothetical protein
MSLALRSTQTLAAALAVAALAVAAIGVSPAAADTRPFAPTSFWNAELGAGAPLDSQSSTYVADLQRQLTVALPWINTTKFSSPIYTVDAGVPTVRVQVDNPAPAAVVAPLQAAFEQVPIPSTAAPAAGTDGTMVVYQPSTDTMWEFWQASKKADGWHAVWGGRMSGVSQNPGHFTDPYPRWGATATSLPFLGGLMRVSEMQSGHIDHALAIAIPETRARVFSWPAQRTDGQVDSTTAIPEGTRFRLPASLNLDAMPMPGLVRIMAKAVQKYGMVVRDRGNAVAFYGEDPSPLGFDWWGSWFAGRYPSTLLAQFPWAYLQALQTQLRTN